MPDQPTLDQLLDNARRARTALTKAQDDLMASESMYVQAARKRQLTWQAIGDNLGMSHQAAWEKHHNAAHGIPRRANMNDVAALVGVTRRTVYRVLCEPHLVSHETRQAVVRAMATIGYEHPDDGRTKKARPTQPMASEVAGFSAMGPTISRAPHELRERRNIKDVPGLTRADAPERVLSEREHLLAGLQYITDGRYETVDERL